MTISATTSWFCSIGLAVLRFSVFALGAALIVPDAAQAQSMMRSPSINFGSRTPMMAPRVGARIGPHVGMRYVGPRAVTGIRGPASVRTGGAVVARQRSTGFAATRNRVRATVNTGRPTGTNAAIRTAVTPQSSGPGRNRPNASNGSITANGNSRIPPIRPLLPYVRYSPNLYPVCGYAERDVYDQCREVPIAGIAGGGTAGGGPPARGQNGPAPRNSRHVAAAGLRYVPGQVVAELEGNPADADALARRHRLERVDAQSFPLIGTTLALFRVADRRGIAAVQRELSADAAVRSVQPNFRYSLQDTTGTPLTEGDPAQYAVAKLRLPEAHKLSRGADVTVAVIDSQIDADHPELAGAIVQSWNALGGKAEPHVHGTGVAGAIVAHARLIGGAPAARIIAIRAFGISRGLSESTSFVLLRSLDYAVSHGAQVVNMSFAGPSDPLVKRAVVAAEARGVVLVAASGNAGAKSPPLYPAAYDGVIAVSATDAGDRLFAASNQGSYVALAAPGVDIFLPAPDRSYQLTSGTSFSAAYVTALAALMKSRNPALTPETVRSILMKTARDLGPPGRDDQFGAGEADAFAAVTASMEGMAPAAAAAATPAAGAPAAR